MFRQLPLPFDTIVEEGEIDEGPTGSGPAEKAGIVRERVWQSLRFIDIFKPHVI